MGKRNRSGPVSGSGSVPVQGLHLCLYDPSPNGKQNELGMVFESEFSHEVCAVGFDSSRADKKPVRYFSIGVAFGCKLKHLPLASGQCFINIQGGRLGSLYEKLNGPL